MKKINRVVLMLSALLMMMVSAAQADDSTGIQPSSQGAGVSLKGAADTANPPEKSKAVKKSKSHKAKTAAVVEKDTWICPMCRIKSDKPGKCPDCGMDMVKLPKASKTK